MEEVEYRVEAWIVEDSGPEYLQNLKQSMISKNKTDNEEVTAENSNFKVSIRYHRRQVEQHHYKHRQCSSWSRQRVRNSGHCEK